AGKVAADEQRMPEHGLQPLALQLRPCVVLEHRGRGPADELPRDGPVDEPHAELQRARPVRAQAVRTGREPALQVPPQDVEMTPFAAQRIRLSQRHEMQVAIELPKVLDITDASGIAI